MAYKSGKRTIACLRRAIEVGRCYFSDSLNIADRTRFAGEHLLFMLPSRVAYWLFCAMTLRDVNKYGEGQLSPAARYVYHPRLRAAVRKLLPLRYHDAVWHFAFRLFWRESRDPKTDKAKIRECLHGEINETIDRTSEILGRDLRQVWAERGSSRE